MLYRVLAPFNYAADGFTLVRLAPGDEVEIAQDVAPGLVEAGLIDDPAASPAKPARRKAS